MPRLGERGVNSLPVLRGRQVTVEPWWGKQVRWSLGWCLELGKGEKEGGEKEGRSRKDKYCFRLQCGANMLDIFVYLPTYSTELY